MCCYFWIQNELDIRSKEVRIPWNTYRAVIEVYSSAHGNDEFWYSNPPDAYLLSVRNIEVGRGNLPVPCPCAADMKKLVSKRGYGAFREVLVKIDGNLVGSVVSFPVIFTSGINPLFWEPVVGIGAFDLPSSDIELTPFIWAPAVVGEERVVGGGGLSVAVVRGFYF